jgi:hypothetical protein
VTNKHLSFDNSQIASSLFWHDGTPRSIDSAFGEYFFGAPRRSVMHNKEEERRAQLLIGKRGPAPKGVGPAIRLRGSLPPDDRSAHGLPSHLVRAPVRTPVAYSRAVPGGTQASQSQS